jgi:hypothetical protein
MTGRWPIRGVGAGSSKPVDTYAMQADAAEEIRQTAWLMVL